MLLEKTLVRLLAFLGERSSKTRFKKKMQKFHVKNVFRENSQKIDKNFDVVFPRLFLFYRVFRCFFAMGVQKHYKKTLTKKSCRKVFTKKSTKKSQTDFLVDFLYHVFGLFSVKGVQKHDKKSPQKN
jgi:hypothetical protein